MPPSVRIRVRIVAIPPGIQHVTKTHSPNLAEISARTQFGQQSVHIPINMQYIMYCLKTSFKALCEYVINSETIF